MACGIIVSRCAVVLIMPVDTAAIATAFGINSGVCVVCLAAFSLLRLNRFTRRFYEPRR